MRQLLFSGLVCIVLASVNLYAPEVLDTIESVSALFEFDMSSFEGDPQDKAALQLNKVWVFASDRLYQFIYKGFVQSSLSGSEKKSGEDLLSLGKRVGELGNEIFKFQIYDPRSKKEKMYDKKVLLTDLERLKKVKDTLKKELSKKSGFKEKAKLFFSSKTTKAIKNDEQEVKTLLSHIVDLLGKLLVKIEARINETPEARNRRHQSKQRAGE